MKGIKGWSIRVLALSALLLVPFGTGSALAVHDDGDFELEGDVADDAARPAPDWASRFDASGASLAGPNCAFVADDIVPRGSADRTTFAASAATNKNNNLIATWNWTTGNVPLKDDLGNAYTCAVFTDAGELVIYAAGERLAPEGASHIDFQFYQQDIGLDQAPPCDAEQADDPPCEFTGEKQIGDFVVSLDFQQGGKLGSVSVRVWNGTEYVFVEGTERELGVQGCNAEDTVCAFSNTDATGGGPWPNYDRHGNVIDTLAPQMFSEFGVNVTEMLGTTPCIATFIVKTRSSPSFTSELMDFAATPLQACPSKSGTKFEDVNGNGARDAGEPGLAGWEIRAYDDVNGNGVLDTGETTGPIAATTDADGNYSLDLTPGKYVVCEVLQAGWLQSTPNNTVCSAEPGLAPGGYAIDLGPNEHETGNDFGNYRQAEKSGVKFEDVDADGTRDPQEPGLAGWTIFVDYDGNGSPGAGEPSAVTGAGGVYSITGIEPGTYAVREVQQPGWTCSFPSPCFYTETFASGGRLSGNDFGNYRRAAKSGLKFEDANANGFRDPGEPGLPGWTIFVDYDGNGSLGAGEPSAVTGAGGVYSITGIEPGTYAVREVQQPGWTCSFPRPCFYTETFTSGRQAAGNDFGNYRAAVKSGTKYEDVNGNGARDAGEPGLPGWTIRAYADANGNGVLDTGEAVAATTTTDATGAYSLTLAPGRYVVCEVMQANWAQTQPANAVCGAVGGLGRGGYGIALASGAVDAGNDFGNARVLIDLAITKTDAPDPVTVGDNITYTVTVVNNGPSNATGVVVTDPLPLDRVSFLSVATSQGSCSGIQPLVCTLGNLAVGASATITIVVKANVTGTVTNPARVRGNEPETNLANNEAVTTTLVVAPLRPPAACASLTLSKRTATIGVRAVVRATVRDTEGRPMAGVQVTARGAGVRTSARTNGAGIARLAVRPRSRGVITVRAAGSTRCAARISVPAKFVPPLTGRKP